MKTLAIMLGLFASSLFAQAVTPVPKAHAHNDYEHDRPLLDALDQGFCSVEADVFAIDGELRIAHNRRDTKPGRTLEKFYLDPLLERVKANKGSVHEGGPDFTLLIDFKTSAEPTYELLKKSLNNYREMLVAKKKGGKAAVTVVVSGNRPFDQLKADKDRLCGLDGRLSDLETDMAPRLMPMISDNWRNHFKWRGEGEFPEAEREKLREVIAKAHKAKRRVRFWATPENEALWQELLDADADHINTDQLARLRKFLLSKAN